MSNHILIPVIFRQRLVTSDLAGAVLHPTMQWYIWVNCLRKLSIDHDMFFIVVFYCFFLGSPGSIAIRSILPGSMGSHSRQSCSWRVKGHMNVARSCYQSDDIIQTHLAMLYSYRLRNSSSKHILETVLQRYYIHNVVYIRRMLLIKMTGLISRWCSQVNSIQILICVGSLLM